MDELVRHALALRAESLRALAGAPPRAAALAAVPPGAWRLFLRVERCALPLRAALAGAELPAGARAVLQERATVELQRVLSARAQLRVLAAVAAERGWQVVALKGGAELAAGGAALDLADVDVLVAPELVLPLAGALEARGLHAHGRDAGVGAAEFWHLAHRRAPHSVQVEVHFTVRDLDPARALACAVPAGVSVLSRLAPADEAWLLLVHSVTHHLNRRGVLRELLLLAAVLPGCTGGERAEVEARAAAHRHAAALAAELEMADALAAGRAPADRFRDVAAAAYLVTARYPQDTPAVFATDLTNALFARVAGGADVRALWAAAGARPGVGSSHPAVAWLERRAAPLGRGARVAQRALRLLAAGAAAEPLAFRARRLAREG